MNINVYSIYDAAAKAYTQPFFVHNHGIAIRLFTDNVNSNEANNISNHPSQFTLFHIGTWDDNKGHIEAKTPEALGNGAEYKNPEPETELGKKIQQLIDKLNEE